MRLDRLTPVEEASRRKTRIIRLVILAVSILLVYWLVFVNQYVIAYEDDVEHFKYGSIGSESVNGLPLVVFQALPKLFEDRMGPLGYRRFGFLFEEGRDLPIGVSRRIVDGVERVWLNCSICHTGTYRLDSQDGHRLLVGAPSNKLKLFEFIAFLRSAATDSRFTADNLLQAYADTGASLSWPKRFIYRHFVVDRVRDGLLELREQLAFMDRQHPWGPGRVDTFNPYKAIQFNFPMDEGHISPQALNGAADYPSLWMQRPRQGMQLHWDGNNSSVQERNLSAALGAGVTPTSVDRASIARIERWMMDLPAPRFPPGGAAVDPVLRGEGEALYGRYCADCHGAPEHGGDAYDYDPMRWRRLGRVEPLEAIGTDAGRFVSYTERFAGAQNLLYVGYPWRFRHFRKTEGYSNQPLDGIWARSPYLHNGSVPTLRALLERSEDRPKIYCRGNDELDVVHVGYRAAVADKGRAPVCSGSEFVYDTRILGNSNAGHEGAAYGTQLEPRQKDAIVEYMKGF